MGDQGTLRRLRPADGVARTVLYTEQDEEGISRDPGMFFWKLLSHRHIRCIRRCETNARFNSGVFTSYVRPGSPAA
jgi:hypothetical protein